MKINEVIEAKKTKTRLDPSCQDGYKIGSPKTKMNSKGDTRVNNCVAEEEIVLEDDQCFHEIYGYLAYSEDENDLFEAEYQGRTVKLNKPISTGKEEPKKFKVYVKDGDKVKMVRFGHQGKGNEKTMRIRKDNPAARKSFRARHKCDNPGPKTKARYWSCKKW